MKLMKNMFLHFFVASLFIFVACEDEKTEDKPEKGSISGSVSFIGDFPPADSGSVRISIHRDWYPTGPPYSYKEIAPEEVINNVYAYEFTQVAFGTYSAIAVDFVAAGSSSDEYTIWGVYGGTLQAGFMNGDSVVVSITEPDITGIDIDATIY